MSLPSDPQSELRKAIENRGAIIVAGTGVSIAASNNHPQASWTGLLKSGLELLRKHNLISQDDSDAHLQLLNSRPETAQFIATAQAISQLMSPIMFRDWLKETIGSIKACNRETIKALEGIRQCGNVLATTNYDGLLLESHPDLSALTWKDKAEFLNAYRNRDAKHVLFLHGYWEAPESVILDERSYQEITRDQKYRDELTAIWRTSTWIYVGCGENGLSDPDIGLLLELYGKAARNDNHWDFCLVRKADKNRLQRYFDNKGHNICAVAFGENHGDLPGYLHSLLPIPFVGPPHVPLVPKKRAGARKRAVAHLAPASTIIPAPPAFYAEPKYIGSHQFVGRARELEGLSDWAAPADPTNLLLFEAIGGNGKSMLTWEWTKNHALAARPADAPWAGRFWYSFYERGALMQDFCQHALGYMTGRPLEHYAKKKTAELTNELLAQLHARPWLLILDGLERVLVAYHRIDAAEVPDEEANAPTDKISNRNPCDAIRDEDNDLLRALAAAAPSKLLVSSRLTPRVLLNPSGQSINGVKRITLPGLRPPDAEELLRSCGIVGNSAAIQSYLAANCDNHPLVIGILGGLIANYLPARGNFDIWSTATNGGAALDLGSLDLIQRRNHILHAAIDALSSPSRQLLSTLALLTDSVDYETLKAFNPHLPPESEEVERPTPPEEEQWHFVNNEVRRWGELSDELKVKLRKQYEAAFESWQDYEREARARRTSEDFHAAPKKLEVTVKDLEQRGLLQWNGGERKYDLHPVVRGVASGAMSATDREVQGQRVVDHFTAQPHRPYEEAETMEDVANGLHLVRTLLKLGHFQQASAAYQGELSNALIFNLDCSAEVLSLLKPFFPTGWSDLPEELSAIVGSDLGNDAALALSRSGDLSAALTAYGAVLRADLEEEEWSNAAAVLRNISASLSALNRLAQASLLNSLALDISMLSEIEESIFMSRLYLFSDLSELGQWAKAVATWRFLDPMGRAWSRNVYRLGWAEREYTTFHFWQGTLQEEELAAAEHMAVKGKDRSVIRGLHRLRGDWRLEQGEWALAAASYKKALRLARERGLTDAGSETGLALAKHHLGQLPHPSDEAERLAQLPTIDHRYLALLWLEIGDTEQAKHHALASYRWAWADGEPYVHRYELTKTTELLQQLNVPIPNLPPYDPAKDEKLPWEDEVRADIEKLRQKKEAEKLKNWSAESSE